MFRLFVLLCLMHFSVGIIIRGQILLNGNANLTDSVPTGSQLIVRLEDTSIADAPAITLQETTISNLVTFPANYEIQIPNNIPSTLTYSLSATIKKGDLVLYLTVQNIPVSIGVESPITVDIPVMIVRGRGSSQRLVNSKNQPSWPELVGREGTYAVQYIKEKTSLTNVMTIPEDSFVTMDYRMDRVRVFVNKNGIVTRIPHIG